MAVSERISTFPLIKLPFYRLQRKYQTTLIDTYLHELVIALGSVIRSVDVYAHSHMKYVYLLEIG